MLQSVRKESCEQLLRICVRLNLYIISLQKRSTYLVNVTSKKSVRKYQMQSLRCNKHKTDIVKVVIITDLGQRQKSA